MLGPSPCYVNDGDYVGGFEREDIEGLLDTMERNFLGWAQFLAPLAMKNGERPGLAQELEESICSTDPEIMRRFAEATFFADNRADLPKVSVPCLILQCSEDTIAPLSVGTYLHQNLRGSTLRKCVSAGEALPAATRALWKEATGLDMTDGIGATEMFHIFISSPGGESRRGAIGKVVSGYTAKVVNDEGVEAAPREEIGGAVDDLLLALARLQPAPWRRGRFAGFCGIDHLVNSAEIVERLINKPQSRQTLAGLSTSPRKRSP